ncbi:MAG: prolyl oligopeptidase family serine peptidase [Chloroflexota bacterium]
MIDQRRSGLTVEAITAVEPPREFRLHPRDRVVAYVAEGAGARQLFTLALTGGPPTQLTASEKHVSDPQWSPDGRRLAFVRGDDLWVIERSGERLTHVDGHPAGVSHPRWAPDGHRLAFLSRRRGWSQIWIVDAPVPRRGRPAKEPRPPEVRPMTAAGTDIDGFEWSPDGSRIAAAVIHGPEAATGLVVLVDTTTGTTETISSQGSWSVGPRWASDGGLLFVTDTDGWFQVVRRSPDGRELTVLTAGAREHGEPTGGVGWMPLPSPDAGRFVHTEVHDGLADLVVAPLAAASPVRRPRGRPPKMPRPAVVAASGAGVRIDPWDGVWRSVGWMPSGAWVVAVGESDRRPQDLWLLPVPGVAPEGARARQVTNSLPGALSAAVSQRRSPAAARFGLNGRDGTRLEGTVWRPVAATGKRGGTKVPAVIYVHGGPTWQSFRGWFPFKHVLVDGGFAVVDVDFRGSTGYGREFRLANRGEWGNADVHDAIDAARWAAAQPWCDGRLAIWGGSYGGYLVLCALVEEPSLWRAGVDLYGDSDIAESFRHGDRPGRLDLERQMGSPDDPARADVYRRGSPVFRTERIEAPLLLLHGRKDRRVVPLMTEKMVEALTIEGKHHEVHWYDEEAHGWEQRENRRDASRRILAFLRRHVLDEIGDRSGSSG